MRQESGAWKLEAYNGLDPGRSVVGWGKPGVLVALQWQRGEVVGDRAPSGRQSTGSRTLQLKLQGVVECRRQELVDMDWVPEGEVWAAVYLS